jgi:AsmA protein
MPELRTRRWPKIVGAIVVILAVLAVAGVLALDRILLSQVRARTDALSRSLGRPVTVDGVATKLWGGLGVKVTGVGIGAAEGEGVPLAALGRAEVEADLWRAARSGGKEVVVREAVLEGLQLNVIRFPDGTTNLERLSKDLAKQSKPAAPEEAQAEPKAEADLSAIRIDRAALVDARIAFFDRSVPGAKELSIEDLDVEVKDLQAGQPLEVVVKAAVLASAQNLELRLRAAPLPPSLTPTPETLTLRVQPIDLAPLAPFVPASVGLRGGRFQADLAVALGAAVPGGKGPTTVKGGFRAEGLAFAGQEGGKRLDAALDADLDADMVAGDLRIGKLDLAIGPAGLTGRGRASGLTGESPRVDGLEIVGRGLDPAAIAAYWPPLRKLMGGVVVQGPIGVLVRGSGSEAAQALDLRVDLGPVRLVVPASLAKAAGAPMLLTARAKVAGGGPIRFEGALDLAGADLRPGGTLAKKPGDPLSVKAAGSWRKVGAGQEIELTTLDLDLLGDRLSGRAKVALSGAGAKSTTRFDAALEGARLDLDRLLIPAPDEKAGGAPAPEKKSDPAAYAGLSGLATAKLGVVRSEGVEVRNVVVRARMENDLLTLEQARLEAFGGHVTADGTSMRLAQPDAPFKVALGLKGVAGEQVLSLLSKQKVLSGTLDADLALDGKGFTLAALKKSLTGALGGNLRGGTFHGKDLVGAVAAPLAARLPFASGKIGEGAGTPLGKELPFSFKIADGLARLEKPLRFAAAENAVALEGGVRLDGTLEMPATIALSPALIAKLTGGRAKPQAPIPVAFRLTGPAWSPRIEGLSLDGAIQAIVKQAASGALGKALGAEGASVDEVAAKKRAEAETRAREEAARAKQKLEDEAKKRLKGLFGR